MPYCPNCGSYVSPGSNICSCGTTFGYSSEVEKERQPTEFEIKQEEERKICQGYYKKAEKLMDDGRYLEAIEYFDKLIEISSGRYLLHKARAYYWAGMYEEALSFFRQALKHYWGIDTYVIWEWIGDTLNELNRFKEAIDAYEWAIDVINEEYERLINFFKSERWMGYERIEHACASSLEERNERLSEVEKRIDYSKKLKSGAISKKPTVSEGNYYNEQKKLMGIGKENLITITGTFFHGNFEFKKGIRLKLIREPDNKYDGDAIAVYFNDKVGYVANSDRTCCYLTSKASDVKIQDISYAEYIMNYNYMFHIAKIIK